MSSEFTIFTSYSVKPKGIPYYKLINRIINDLLILSVAGARSNFMKISPFVKAIKNYSNRLSSDHREKAAELDINHPRISLAIGIIGWQNVGEVFGGDFGS